jgi:hypothetical protein
VRSEAKRSEEKRTSFSCLSIRVLNVCLNAPQKKTEGEVYCQGREELQTAGLGESRLYLR